MNVQLPEDSWNVRWFEQWHATTSSPIGLVHVAAWLSELSLYVALALTLTWLIRRKDALGAILVATSMAMAMLLEFIVATAMYHPRPFAAGFGQAGVHHEANNAMPSTYATVTWVMAFVGFFRHQHATALVLFSLGALMACRHSLASRHGRRGRSRRPLLCASWGWPLGRPSSRINPLVHLPSPQKGSAPNVS